ncbi:MAG: O-antigen ligase family protein [Planctomycetaceae bacterium]
MRSASPWSERFGVAAIVLLLVTVCLLPWLHGGNIPLARLVLQVGSAAAALLSLVSSVLRREQSEFPRIIFPLGVLFAVAVIQLTPVHAPMVSQMNHAVLADLRPDFTQFNQSEMTVRTASPGDTRMVAAQLVALMLLAITAFDQIRTQRTVIWSLATFTANASLLSLLALVQSLQADLFLIRDEWWTGMGMPFGTFVNPNNAAGWFALGLASGIGLLVLQLDTPAGSGGYSRHDNNTIQLISRIIRYIAALNSRQVLVWFSIALIVCAIAATRSRGGMMAAVIALGAMILVCLQVRRLAVITIVLLASCAAITSLMVYLNLHQGAIQELQTLRDPAGELAGRFQHWRDSLRAVSDFPVLGGGLGAYRYVTLPFQTKDIGAWSQNADNQYVEVLVEAGMIGCAAFVMLGLPILLRAIRAVRLFVVGAAGRSAAAVALVLVFATVSQATSAFVDFGTALPASSSLFVVLTSMLAAIQEPALSASFRPSGRLVAAGMRFVLIAAAILFTRDLSAAHECYVATIAGRKLDEPPGSWEGIREREMLLDTARIALTARSDDARTLELVSRLLDDVTRSQFLRGLPGLHVPENFQNAWPRTTCIALARRMNSLSDDPVSQQHLRKVFLNHLDRSGIAEHADDVLLRMPLPAPVVRRTAKWLVASRPRSQSDEYRSRARFMEPANGQLGFELGEIAFLNGHPSQPEDIWKYALKSDESLRYLILDVYATADRMAEGFETFGPTIYAHAVKALMQSRRPELTDRLRSTAASLWVEPESTPSTQLQQVRDYHLRHLGDLQARIEWLERCVSWQPDTLRYHQELAIAYSNTERWGDSEDQWYEVLRLDAENQAATRGIAAIREKRNHQEK